MPLSGVVLREVVVVVWGGMSHIRAREGGQKHEEGVVVVVVYTSLTRNSDSVKPCRYLEIECKRQGFNTPDVAWK